MLNKNEMLNFIAQNAEMGCCGIAFIKGYAKDEKLQKALRTQMIEYGKIYSNANNILKSDICTCCNSEYLHSHRATGGERGILCSLIYL